MSVKLIIPMLEYREKVTETMHQQVDEGRKVFTCSPYAPGYNQVEVYVNGQYQYLNLDFTELSGTDIQLIEPCMQGDDVLIKVRR